MRIVVDINHPAHVHFFKNFIWNVKDLGHEVLITTIDKDIAVELLDHYKFDYILLGSFGKGILQKLVNIPILDLKMYYKLFRFHPQAILGIASFKAAHVSKLFSNCKSYIFDDTEHAKAEITLYKPFATKICTPRCFYKDLGPKQIRYNGYHELAYLSDKYFKPDSTVLDNIGINENDVFFVVRFVAWQACHDIGQKGFSNEGKLKVVKELEKYGRVLITSETPLPHEFDKYRISLSPTKIHDLLYYANMYIGEGGTMATEAAVLGTPAVFINTLTAGTFQELENKYDLLHAFSDETKAFEFIKDTISQKDLKQQYQAKRQIMIEDKIDVNAWMIDLITKGCKIKMPY